MNNYYTHTRNDHTRYPPLNENLRTDVVIVGGGFTGVATALGLAERGKSVVLLEAQHIGFGATGRNGGQVTGSLSGDTAMERQLKSTMGEDALAYVWDLRWRGHAIIEERIARYGIECDLKRGHLHTAWTPADVINLKKICADAERYNADFVRWLDQSEVHEILETPLYFGGIKNNRNLHLHSLNLVLGEARAAASLGVKIFEHSAVLEILDGVVGEVRTRNACVKADAVLLAGNAYHQMLKPSVRGLMFPAVLGNMTTVSLGEELASRINHQDVAVYDSRMVLDYYRLTADNRLMFGGGTSYSGREIADVEAALRPALETTFPQLKGIKIDFSWTGKAGIVLNRIPLLGRSSTNVFFAQGYSGHGIATSHIVAEICADALLGTLDEFDVFAGFKHTRLPVGTTLGNQLLALGMWYYQQRERMG